MMKLNISRGDILNNLYRQLNSFFYCSEEEKQILDTYIDKALERSEICFLAINNKYWTLLGGG